jgi:phenylacetic acid degradation operon negative regulatory protein
VIYAAGPKRWSERWTLVALAMIEAAAREALRDDLAWQGFGQLGAELMLHPEPDEASLRQALVGLSGAMVMNASADQWMQQEDVHRLVAQAWDLERLGAVYAEFLEDFRPFLAVDGFSPASAFRLRTLLIHAWRRAVLRDPLLPEELLPVNWLGASARLLCRNLYRLIQGPAEVYLAQNMETADGPPGPPSQKFFERFGGLAEPAPETIA